MKNGTLESKIGFKWVPASREASCAITGETFNIAPGFTPVLLTTKGRPGLVDQLINPTLLSKYAVSAYIEWKGLCAKHNTHHGEASPQEIVIGKHPLKLDADVIDLVYLFRELAKKLVKDTNVKSIDATTINQAFVDAGFIVKASRSGVNYANDAVTKIALPMLSYSQSPESSLQAAAA